MSPSSEVDESTPKTSRVSHGKQPAGNAGSTPDTKPAPTGTQPPADSDLKIIIQVGEQRFHTQRSTLVNGSPFFASFFSNPRTKAQRDGSYFLNANPKLLAHILAYLRREVLPVFYDPLRGFDHAFYRELWRKAEFFRVRPLAKWIWEKGYLKTVRQECTLAVISEDCDDDEEDPFVFDHFQAEPDTEVMHFPSCGTRSRYECPRNIALHDDNSHACGRQCYYAREAMEREGKCCYVDQSVFRVLRVTKKIVFNDVN